MKRVVIKTGVYLYKDNTDTKPIFCGDVWESTAKWHGAFSKALPKKILADGDLTPRVKGDTKEEAAAALAKLAQKHFSTTNKVIKFGEPSERKKKTNNFVFS
jgi:hypothetical protein